MRYLVNELGADVNQVHLEGKTPLFIAASGGNLDIVQFLINELGADVNQEVYDGCTPPMHDGYTALMCAARVNNQALIKHLVHKCARVRAVSTRGETVIRELEFAGATAAQIAYLEVRECCANLGCDGGGRKRSCVCKETRYCGMACRVAHWRVHREGCRPPIDTESEGSEVAS
jgi:ankyrin repeat protein